MPIVQISIRSLTKKLESGSHRYSACKKDDSQATMYDDQLDTATRSINLENKTHKLKEI